MVTNYKNSQIYKNLARLRKKLKVRNKRGDVTTDVTEIHGIIRE